MMRWMLALLLVCPLLSQGQYREIVLDSRFYTSDFQPNYAACGLYVTQFIMAPQSNSYTGEVITPHWKEGDEVFLKWLSTFTCTDVLLTCQQQPVIVEYTIGIDGQVSNVRASQARDGVLEYELTEFVPTMPAFVPGTMEGNPVAYRGLMMLTFHPGE